MSAPMLRTASRAFVALALLASQAHAQSVQQPPGAVTGGKCPAGQAMNGITTTGAPDGCYRAASPVYTFYAPLKNGGTSINYPLPSTTAGVLRIHGITNGGPGGGGALGAAGSYRQGGSGGSGGSPFELEFTIADLVAQFPGITSITTSFGTLGTPGSAVSAAGGGTSATNSSAVVLGVNATGTIVYQSLVGYGGFGGRTDAVALTGGPNNIDVLGYTSNGAASAASAGAGVAAGRPLGAGASGGSSGGGVNTSNTETVGAKSLVPIRSQYVTSAGTAGAIEGSAAAGVVALLPNKCTGGVGGPSGGSSASASVNAGSGAAGVGYGAGGGAGGGGTTGAASGAGGAAQFGCIEFEFIAQ